jgi:hypothetical protein
LDPRRFERYFMAIDPETPLIYVIPFDAIAKRAIGINPAAAAKSFSAEYKILSPDRSDCDIIRPRAGRPVDERSFSGVRFYDRCEQE